MKTPKSTAKIEKLIEFYYHSPAYLRITGKTQLEYERCLTKAMQTTVKHKTKLANIRICDLTAGMLATAYEKWVESYGIRQANYTKSALSVAWRYGMTKDIMIHNPVAVIKTIATKPRKVKWERSDIKAFLTVAYSKWEYRSLGLLVHMSYDWGQRVGDMRMLKWESLDLDQCRMDLTQSKRGADVHLPISQNLCQMLRTQKEEFGFQDYVAPKISINKGLIRPYLINEISNNINAVLDEANLSRELTAMDLRRTAVTEMMEAGVDLVGIMQVTGHASPTSLAPYMVNTFSGASKALSARGNEDEHS